MGSIDSTSGYGSQYYIQQLAKEKAAEPVTEPTTVPPEAGYASQYVTPETRPDPEPPQPPAPESGYGSHYANDPGVVHQNSAFPTIVEGYGSQYDYEPSPPLDPVNNPADRQVIAERNAPILVLPAGSNDNLPASAQEFIDNSRLREDVSWRGDNQFGDNTNDNDGDDFSGADFADAPDNYFLDLDNDQRYELGKGQDNPAPLYYELDTDSDIPTITYFVFYAYNDGPSVQNHEGDWERITLELDPDTFEPTTARLSAHSHRTDVPLDNADPQNEVNIIDPLTGRPVIYVAGGSHAAYPTAGEFATEVPVFKDTTVANPNGDAFRTLDDAVIYDEWGGVLDVTEQPWYPSAGNNGVRWGEIGETSHTSGPYGPSTEKGIVDNPIREEDGGLVSFIADIGVVENGAQILGDTVEDANTLGGVVYDTTRNHLQDTFEIPWWVAVQNPPAVPGD